MSDSRRGYSYAWAIVGMLWIVACLNYLDRLMIASMRDSVKADILMTEAQFGLLTSVFLWVYGTLSPLGGFVADRFSRKWVIVGSLGVWSVVTWLTGHVHSFEAMLIARALMGISEAFYIPAGLAMIADYHRGSTRSLATGLHMSGVYAGAALGGLGGYIADDFGWRQGFTWFGVGGVIYSVILFFLLKDIKAEQPGDSLSNNPNSTITPGAAMRELFLRPSFLALLSYFGLFAIANWGINGWLPTYLRENFNLGQGKAGMSATGYIQLASFVGVLIGGFLSDRWVKKNPRGRLYIPVIGFFIGGPFLFLMASTDAFAIAIAGMVMYGLGRGFSDTSTMPILCQIVDSRYRATGYGILNLFSTYLGGVMILVGGMLRDASVNLSLVFKISAAGLVLAAMMLLFIKPNRATEESSRAT